MTVQTLDEAERRRIAVANHETDYARWTDPRSFEAAWERRAAMAAQFIPSGVTVLDLGCGGMAIERHLPAGCSYQPCDLAQRDARTIVCDFNRGEFPTAEGIGTVTALGVLEYLRDPSAFLRALRRFNVPVVLSYSITDRRPDLDRAAQGWVNAMSEAELLRLAAEAGFRLRASEAVDPLQSLFKFEPGTEPTTRAPAKRVLTLSYFNDHNFGDRLGIQIINRLLPPTATVFHATVKPWTVPETGFDLLVLGLGHSLNAATVRRPELFQLMDRIPHTVGVFGTQYREQYTKLIDPTLLGRLIDRLDVWWARYEEDVIWFGKGRKNVRHLGDCLISEFPLTTPTLDKVLNVPPEIKSQPLSLDRVIQQIQSYKKVFSARIHPLLCAITSAEEVAYQEQHEDPSNRTSGKFRSLLMDVFGRTYPENSWFKVDRDAVSAYKERVASNLEGLRADLARLLSSRERSP